MSFLYKSHVACFEAQAEYFSKTECVNQNKYEFSREENISKV